MSQSDLNTLGSVVILFLSRVVCVQDEEFSEIIRIY